MKRENRRFRQKKLGSVRSGLIQNQSEPMNGQEIEVQDEIQEYLPSGGAAISNLGGAEMSKYRPILKCRF